MTDAIFQKINTPWGVYIREKYLCKKIGLKRGEGICLKGAYF